MATHPDVLIIGGGVIGLTTAYFLARERLQVQVLDKGDFGQEASWAGAGIIPPANARQARTPFDRLRGLSSDLFPALSEELRQLTGIDNGFVRCGGLEFIGSGGQARHEEWHGEGLAFQTLDEPALARLEPNLAKDLGAAHYLPDMAQLRNPRHVKALLAACKSCGVKLHPGCAVHGFVHEGQHVSAIRTLAGPIAAERFLIASGAWTDPLLEGLGWRPGIQPVRGQIVLLKSEVPLFRRILIWGARYLVPRPDGRVLVGSTEECAGFDKRTTSEAVADLLTLAHKLVPCLGKVPVEMSWAGLRPGSPDGLPYLGLVPGFDNLFLAAGHFRAGIQLSPGTAQVMKECLLQLPMTIPLEPFRLERCRGFQPGEQASEQGVSAP